MEKLTKRLVESSPVPLTDVILWDQELKGFCCKITPAGKRVYLLYYRTKDGRQRKPKIGDHGALSCEQARAIARQWLGEVVQGKDPAAQKEKLKKMPTMRELAGRYTKDHAPRKKLSSQKEDQRLLQAYILPALGDVKVSAINRDDIVKVHQSLHHKAITGNRVLSLLSKLLNLSELWGYRPDHTNPCRHVKKYKEDKRERFLNPEEISRLHEVLLEEAQKGQEMPSVIYALQLLLFTGCRLNEILTLQWSEVNLAKNCLMLQDSKTGKRIVYLSPEAVDLLSTIPKEKDNPYVITGKNHQSHLINLQKPWRRLRKKAGLDDVRIHDLRHTFASVAAEHGLSLPMIGALLGHKQTQTTARYAHLVGKPLIEAASKVGSALQHSKRKS